MWSWRTEVRVEYLELPHFCFRFVCFHFLFSLLLFCFFFLPPLKFVYFVHFEDVNECKGNASQIELYRRNCDGEVDWGKGKTDF